MRVAGVVGAVLGLMIGSAQAVQVASTFDDAGAGVDGWTAVGDPVGGAPVYQATGGNPGGYAQVTDQGAGLVMYWVAPAKFTGDLSAYFGGTLSYDMRQTPVTGLFIPGAPGDVRIVGASLTLVYDLPQLVAEYPQTVFTTRTLRLDDQTPWHVGTDTGALATNAQIQSVLGGVTDLRIRGEYSLNVDTNSLDNVVLASQPVPEPATWSLLLGGAGLLAAARRRRHGEAG